MLKIGQLAQIKGESPYTHEVLTQIVNAVNSLGRATGVDPSGTIHPPAPIGRLSVIAADGIFDIAITDNIGNQTLYWRAYSQYLGSDPSEPVTFGTPATAVIGGGTAAGPALQASSGSGTASGSEGGSGFGVVTESVSGPVILR
jgi:hypothetical protein